MGKNLFEFEWINHTDKIRYRRIEGIRPTGKYENEIGETAQYYIEYEFQIFANHILFGWLGLKSWQFYCQTKSLTEGIKVCEDFVKQNNLEP